MRSSESIRVLCLETLAGKPLSSMEHRKAIFKSTPLSTIIPSYEHCEAFSWYFSKYYSILNYYAF